MSLTLPGCLDARQARPAGGEAKFARGNQLLRGFGRRRFADLAAGELGRPFPDSGRWTPAPSSWRTVNFGRYDRLFSGRETGRRDREHERERGSDGETGHGLEDEGVARLRVGREEPGAASEQILDEEEEARGDPRGR